MKNRKMKQAGKNLGKRFVEASEILRSGDLSTTFTEAEQEVLKVRFATIEAESMTSLPYSVAAIALAVVAIVLSGIALFNGAANLRADCIMMGLLMIVMLSGIALMAMGEYRRRKAVEYRQLLIVIETLEYREGGKRSVSM